MRILITVAALFSFALLIVGYTRVLSNSRLDHIEVKAEMIEVRAKILEKDIAKWKVLQKNSRSKARGGLGSHSRR